MRPRWECWARMCAVQHQRDVPLLERVQQRATKTLKALPMREQGLLSLENRRLGNRPPLPTLPRRVSGDTPRQLRPLETPVVPPAGEPVGQAQPRHFSSRIVPTAGGAAPPTRPPRQAAPHSSAPRADVTARGRWLRLRGAGPVADRWAVLGAASCERGREPSGQRWRRGCGLTGGWCW